MTLWQTAGKAVAFLWQTYRPASMRA
jgi:hypothetical protein